MVFLENNRISRELNEGYLLFYKAIFIILVLWLANVMFVVSHESGHCIAATLFGTDVINVYVSPLGLDGQTTYAPTDGHTQAFILLYAGIAMTTLAGAIASILNLDIVVYLMGLRTMEDALLYLPGSDISVILQQYGNYAYAVTALTVTLNVMLIFMALRKDIIDHNSSIIVRYSRHIKKLLAIDG